MKQISQTSFCLIQQTCKPDTKLLEWNALVIANAISLVSTKKSLSLPARVKDRNEVSYNKIVMYTSMCV